MTHVHADLVKNSRNVVVLYKINKVNAAIITTVATAIAIFFLDLIISLKSNLEVWIALRLSGLVTNPFSTSKMIDENALSSEELAKRTIKKDRFLWGPGIGIRYFTGFGPIRVDLAFPMKVRKVSNEKKTSIDSKYQIYISINQDFWWKKYISQ